LYLPDTDVKPATGSTPDEGETTAVALPGDAVQKGKGANSLKSELDVNTATFPDKSEFPAAAAPATPAADASEPPADMSYETPEAMTSEPPAENSTEPVSTETAGTATTEETLSPYMASLAKKPGLLGATGTSSYGYSASHFQLRPELDGQSSRFRTEPSGLIGGQRRLEMDLPPMPTAALYSVNGFRFDLEGYLRNTDRMQYALDRFSAAATFRVETTQVEKLDGVTAKAAEALKSFAYLAEDPTVNKKSAAYKSYSKLQELLTAAGTAGEDRATQGGIRQKIYQELGTFTKAMQTELANFSAAWAKGKGGDPAFRTFLNEQFAALVYQSQLGKTSASKKVEFTDANRDKWPDALKTAMTTIGATNVRELQKKLGIREDGVLGPQVFLAIQLNGLKEIRKGLDSVSSDVATKVTDTQKWLSHLEDLQSKGVEGLLQADPAALQALARLQAGTELPTSPQDLVAKLKELTGASLSTPMAYVVRSLHASGHTAKDGHLVDAKGARLSAADAESLTRKFFDLSSSRLES
jgi:hypothetical protein